MTIEINTMAARTAAESRTARRAVLAGACALSLSAMVTPAAAQGIPLIRDTEIEKLLGDYASPVFQAAGFGSGRIKVRIVQNENFNAFVVDGRNVFIHTGTHLQAKSPNEVI